jgi:TolA-binding protein
MTDREIAFSDPRPAVTRRGYTDHQAVADMLRTRLEAARRYIEALEIERDTYKLKAEQKALENIELRHDLVEVGSIALAAEIRADKAERRADCLDKRLHGQLAAGRVVRRDEVEFLAGVGA